jgi:hypothetical protein
MSLTISLPSSYSHRSSLFFFFLSYLPLQLPLLYPIFPTPDASRARHPNHISAQPLFLDEDNDKQAKGDRWITCTHDYPRTLHPTSLSQCLSPRNRWSTSLLLYVIHPSTHSLSLEPDSSSTRSTQTATINQANQKLTQTPSSSIVAMFRNRAKDRLRQIRHSRTPGLRRFGQGTDARHKEQIESRVSIRLYSLHIHTQYSILTPLASIR